MVFPGLVLCPGRAGPAGEHSGHLPLSYLPVPERHGIWPLCSLLHTDPGQERNRLSRYQRTQTGHGSGSPVRGHASGQFSQEPCEVVPRLPDSGNSGCGQNGSASGIAGKHLDHEYGKVLVALGLALFFLHFSPALRRASSSRPIMLQIPVRPLRDRRRRPFDRRERHGGTPQEQRIYRRATLIEGRRLQEDKI